MDQIQDAMERSLGQLRERCREQPGCRELADRLESGCRELLRDHAKLLEENGRQSRLLEEQRTKLSQLEQLSLEDPLTGLYNRRYLDLRLENEFARARRYGRNLAVAMLDLDRFKAVNDNFSHQAGDRVLQETARILVGNCRGVDLVARYGGEEFVLVLPETPSSGAILVCERIRRTIEEHDWQGLGEGLKVTASFGLCCDLGPGDYRAMLNAADAKLYQAKAAGRNQVKF